MEYSLYDSFIQETKVLDDSNKSLLQIKKEMTDLITPDMNKNILTLLQWDCQLFSCCEIIIENREEGQDFLFPKLVYTNGTKIPDIDNFEEERFSFYRHRYEHVSNKIVKVRYANYFFQYSEKSKKYEYGKELSQLLCDKIQNINISHDCVVSISRLFEVALSFSIQNAIARINELVKEVFSKEYTNEDELWLLSISRTVVTNVEKNKKTIIFEDTINIIIKVIEDVMNYYENQVFDYDFYRNCCQNYIRWLKILKRNDDVKAILIRYGESYEKQAESGENSNLVKANFYEMAAQHFVDIGERAKVYDLKVKIKKAFRDANKLGEYKTVSSPQSISIVQLEQETIDFFGTTIEESFNEVSHSSDFVPKKEPIEKKAEEDAKNPLYKIIGMGRVYGNRKVFNAQNDDDIKRQILSFNYSIELERNFAIRVNCIWDKMVQKGLTPDMVICRICEIEYMEDMQKKLIRRGIERFFFEDYISALHILVPQFESYFRIFFEWGGFPTTSIKSGTTQNEQTFNEFLLQPFVKETINSDILYMIEFVMVDQLGKNLRNNIAHGLAGIDTFSKTNCLIVIHLFFLITKNKWDFNKI